MKRLIVTAALATLAYREYAPSVKKFHKEHGTPDLKLTKHYLGSLGDKLQKDIEKTISDITDTAKRAYYAYTHPAEWGLGKERATTNWVDPFATEGNYYALKNERRVWSWADCPRVVVGRYDDDEPIEYTPWGKQDKPVYDGPVLDVRKKLDKMSPEVYTITEPTKEKNG